MTYRLINDVARRRILYPPPIPTVAAVLVIDIPTGQRGAGLSLDRYYAIFVETAQEGAELERFLAAPRDGAGAPDLLDRRPSMLRAEGILLVRYDPPAVGWPWLSVCRWPDDDALAADAARDSMARGCYTMEMFDAPAALEAHQAILLSSIARHRPIDVRVVAGERLAAPGHS